jgi:hypothetical protein
MMQAFRLPQWSDFVGTEAVDETGKKLLAFMRLWAWACRNAVNPILPWLVSGRIDKHRPSLVAESLEWCSL